MKDLKALLLAPLKGLAFVMFLPVAGFGVCLYTWATAVTAWAQKGGK